MLDKTSAVPLYIQLADRIKADIAAGTIRPGEKLESEAEMVERFAVGRLTVRNALSRLVQEGYLEKAQGKGTFCKGQTEEGKHLNIEVLLDLGNTYFIPVYFVKGISEVLAVNNCNFLISDTCSNAADLCDELEQIVTKGASGVMFQLTEAAVPPERMGRLLACLAAFREKGIPVMMIDGRLDGCDVSYVMLDDVAGGARAAEHFAAYGHRRAAVAYRPYSADACHRYEGFAMAAARFGMEPPVTIDFSRADAEAALLSAVREQGVTAVFGHNDEVALSCIRMLKTGGFRVPEQVSVIGFDDSYLAATAEPPLTSIPHPKERMGKHAALALLRIIRGQEQAPYIEIFEPELRQRGSCARAAARR